MRKNKIVLQFCFFVFFNFFSHRTAVLTLLVPQRVCLSTPLCTGTSLVSFVSLFLSVLIQERRDNVCSQVRVGLLLDSHREHSASHSVRSSPHLCICCTLSAHPLTTVPHHAIHIAKYVTLCTSQVYFYHLYLLHPSLSICAPR